MQWVIKEQKGEKTMRETTENLHLSELQGHRMVETTKTN